MSRRGRWASNNVLCTGVQQVLAVCDDTTPGALMFMYVRVIPLWVLNLCSPNIAAAVDNGQFGWLHAETDTCMRFVPVDLSLSH